MFSERVKVKRLLGLFWVSTETQVPPFFSGPPSSVQTPTRERERQREGRNRAAHLPRLPLVLRLADWKRYMHEIGPLSFVSSFVSTQWPMHLPFYVIYFRDFLMEHAKLNLKRNIEVFLFYCFLLCIKQPQKVGKYPINFKVLI